VIFLGLEKFEYMIHKNEFVRFFASEMASYFQWRLPTAWLQEKQTCFHRKGSPLQRAVYQDSISM